MKTAVQIIPEVGDVYLMLGSSVKEYPKLSVVQDRTENLMIITGARDGCRHSMSVEYFQQRYADGVIQYLWNLGANLAQEITNDPV